MTADVEEGPLDPVPVVPPIRETIVEPVAPPKKSWREQRRERRRRRIWFEELMGWIFVPIILLGTYWLIIAVLDALGTSPSAIMTGINAILSAL
jgi:hypothetical protein